MAEEIDWIAEQLKRPQVGAAPPPAPAGGEVDWVQVHLPQPKQQPAAQGGAQIEFPDAPTVAELPIPSALDIGFGNKAKATLGTMFASDPKAAVNIMLKNVPGTSVTNDKFGNPMIAFQGQNYYIDKPGFTARDFSRVVGSGVLAAPVAAGAGAAAGAAGLGLGGAAILQGLGAFGQSVAEDAISRGAGGENSVNPFEAKHAIAGGIGAGATLAAPALEPIATRIVQAFNSMKVPGLQGATPRLQLLDTATGAPTTTGQALFRQAGIDPTAYTREQLAQMEQAARGALSPGAQAQAVEQAATAARGAEFSVPRTGGQKTGAVDQLQFEDRVRQGGVNNQAATAEMQNFTRAQRGTFDDAVRGAREDMTGMPAGTRADAGQTLLDEFGNAKDAAYNLQRGMWDRVQPRLDLADVQGMAFLDLSKRLRNDVFQRFSINPAEHPTFTTKYTELERMFGGRQTPGMPPGSMQYNPIPFKQLDTYMRQLNESVRGLARSGSADYAATNALKQNLQGWLDDTLAQGLVLGDQRVIQEAPAARAATNNYYGLFRDARNAPTAVNSMLNLAQKNGVTGQEFANAIFGAGRIGNRQGTAAAVDHLERVFGGRDTPGFRALREAYFASVIPEGTGYQKLASTLEDALKGSGKTVTEKLFNTTERALMQRLLDEARMLQNGTTAMNKSGTAYALNRSTLGRLQSLIFGGGGGAGVGEAFGMAMGLPGVGGAAGAAAGYGAARVAEGVTTGMRTGAAINGSTRFMDKPIAELLPAAPVAARALEEPADRAFQRARKTIQKQGWKGLVP
jgi:hypothetical protein